LRTLEFNQLEGSGAGRTRARACRPARQGVGPLLHLRPCLEPDRDLDRRQANPRLLAIRIIGPRRSLEMAQCGSAARRESRPLTGLKPTWRPPLEAARVVIDHVAARCPHSRGNRAVGNSWSGRAGGSAGGCRKPESSRWFSCGCEHGTRSVARFAPLLLLPPGWRVYFPRLGCSGQDEPSAHEVHPAAKTPSIPPASRWRKRPKPRFTRLQRCRVATGARFRSPHMAAKRSPWRLKAPGQPVIGLLGHVLLPLRYSQPVASPPCGVSGSRP
jgi:hypothetical protein